MKPIFTRTLKIGDKGAEVKKLQEYLNQDGDTLVAKQGPGSPGNETEYFGPLTQDAVRRYQCKKDIVCKGSEETTGWGQVGPQTRRALNGESDKNLFPLVRRKMETLVKICEIVGMPIVVTDTYRSPSEQEALYAKGRNAPGSIVTNARAGQSYHNWQCAFDVAFREGARITYHGPWEKIGAIGEALGLEWGGRWQSFPDRPHFQLTLGYTLDDFQSGKVDPKLFD